VTENIYPTCYELLKSAPLLARNRKKTNQHDRVVAVREFKPSRPDMAHMPGGLSHPCLLGLDRHLLPGKKQKN